MYLILQTHRQPFIANARQPNTYRKSYSNKPFIAYARQPFTYQAPTDNTTYQSPYIYGARTPVQLPSGVGYQQEIMESISKMSQMSYQANARQPVSFQNPFTYPSEQTQRPV